MRVKMILTNKYFRRILTLLLLFLVVLSVPVLLLTYQVLHNTIIRNIDTANTTIVAQIKYIYDYYKQTTSNICLEVFVNYKSQQLLYNKDISNEKYLYLNQLTDTTVLTNSFIESIVFYNNTRNEWYATRNVGDYYAEDISDFVNSQQFIPMLKPILRQQTKKIGEIEYRNHVFSYFLYNYSDPATGEDSYMVVNENANWFIDQITSIKQFHGFSESILLLDAKGIVYENADAVTKNAGQYLASQFFDSHHNGESTPQTYVESCDGIQYLVSTIPLGEKDSYLMIVRSHDEVFKDLNVLRRDLLVISGIFVILALISISIMSLRIYRPVLEFVNNIAGQAEFPAESSNKANEFEYLLNVFKHSNEMNKKLSTRSESYEKIVEQHQVYTVVTSGTDEALAGFKKAIPDHWLIKNAQAGLQLLLIKIDGFEKNQFNFETDDMHLLSYAVQNIIDEVLMSKGMYVCFYPDVKTICLIASLAGESMSVAAMAQCMEKVREYVKKYLDITLSIAYSDMGLTLEQLGHMYAQAEEHLRYRYLFGPGRSYTKESCHFNIHNEQTTYSQEYNDTFIAHISHGNISLIRLSLTEIEDVLQRLNYDKAIICVHTLVNAVSMQLKEMHDQGAIANRIDFELLYNNVPKTEFLSDCINMLYDFIVNSLSQEDKAESCSKDPLGISFVIEYINNNYCNPMLTSHLVAEQLGLSNRYVMYKFKETTGMTLSEYITKLRIQKAANLLKNTDLPISQIAERIGLDSATYFYRLFKKYFGCTPREYSERYRS